MSGRRQDDLGSHVDRCLEQGLEVGRRKGSGSHSMPMSNAKISPNPRSTVAIVFHAIIAASSTARSAPRSSLLARTFQPSLDEVRIKE